MMQRISVPTGDILIIEGDEGRMMECLSLQDYGKDVNLNPMGPVVHTKLLPLEEKWVATLSTQYGCSMGCVSCDVPRVGPGVNISVENILSQLYAILSLHPEVAETHRLNIHYARMGEPTWNPAVIEATYLIMGSTRDCQWAHIHPVLSTMMPRYNKDLEGFLHSWMYLKNNLCDGEAGLQISINSTDDVERHHIFGGNAMLIGDVSDTLEGMQPKGRKITLNFAVADYIIDPKLLFGLFDPEKFIIKLTPMHKTQSCVDAGIQTQGDYTEIEPYEKLRDSLREWGYEVLVFIASREEDESRITCGNAILASGSPYKATIVP